MNSSAAGTKKALKITFIYLVISGGWVAAGDRLVPLLQEIPFDVAAISTYSSWIIIAVTAGFIFIALRSGYRSLIQNRETQRVELGRRLKSDLDILARIIDLRVHHNGTRDSAAALKITQFRLQTLSMIYELLLQNGYADHLPFQKVSEHLKNDNFDGLDLHCDELHLPAAKAMTLGLLLNEVVTPFVPDQKDEPYPLSVAVKRGRKSIALVIFRMAEAPESWINRIKDKENSLEGRIIDTLTKKLGGYSSWKQSNGHIKYQIQFKV